MKRLFLLSCMAACMAAVICWSGPSLAMEDPFSVPLKKYTGNRTDDDDFSQSAKTYATSHYIDGRNVNGRNVASAKNTSKKTAKKRAPSTCWKGFLKYCCSCGYKTKTQLDSSDSDSENTRAQDRIYQAQGSVNNNAVSLLENTNINQVTITEMGHDHGQLLSYDYESISEKQLQEGKINPEFFTSVMDHATYPKASSVQQKSFQSNTQTSHLTLIDSSFSQEQGKEKRNGQNRYAGVPQEKKDPLYIYGQKTTNLSSAQGSARNPLSGGGSSSVNKEIKPESTQDGNEFETQFEFINHSTDNTDLKTARISANRNYTLQRAEGESKEVLEFNKSQRRQVQTDAINGVPTVTIGAQEFYNPEPLTPNQKALLQILSDDSSSEFDIEAILNENSTTWEKMKRFFCCGK